MNSTNSNTLYIILNYALNNNIYKLISSIEKYCFSFISLSLKYNFQLYLIYNNSYTLLFPTKVKDPTYFITSNYTEITKSISETLNNFFENVSQAEDKYNPNENSNSPNAINIILKKILLEINQKKKSRQTGEENFFLSIKANNEINDRIILINDSEDDFDIINQKYLFLLKKEKIKIDILSLNENNKNTTSKAICLYIDGFFDHVTKDKNNIEQILIQEYIPIEIKEFLKKNHGTIQNSINYNKAVTNEDMCCSECHKVIKNKDERNDININNNDSHLSFSSMNSNSSNNRINNINSNNNLKLFYLESEKNIFCNVCLKKKQH